MRVLGGRVSRSFSCFRSVIVTRHVWERRFTWTMNYLAHALPNHIRSSLSCLTPIKSKVIDGGPDIAVCDIKGFVHEVKSKKIVNTLNLVEKGVLIRCSYLLENDVHVLYYMVLTDTHRLFIIRRTNKRLQIVKSFDCVKKFEVYDFECLGFPQVGIHFLTGDDIMVWYFPIRKQEAVKAKLCFDNKAVREHIKSSSFADSLEEKLQILSKHIDELSEEYSLLRKQCPSVELAVEFGMVSVGAVKINLPLEKGAQPAVRVCDKWLKIFGTSLVLGIKIHSDHESISDVEVVMEQEEVREYAYRSFEASEDVEGDLFRRRDGRRCGMGGGEVWVFGAFRVPGLVWGSALSVTLRVMSGGMKRCLAKESFEVEVVELVRARGGGEEEHLGGEVLMGARTLKVESHVEVHTEGLGKDMLVAVLTKELGLRRMKDAKEEMFCWGSAYLKEVLVGLRQMEENPSVWEMVLLTSEEAQVCVVVSALYEVLPERTRIVWREE